MSHSQFHCTGRVYLHLHGLIFETSICYWQDQPGSLFPGLHAEHPTGRPPGSPRHTLPLRHSSSLRRAAQSGVGTAEPDPGDTVSEDGLWGNDNLYRQSSFCETSCL